MSSMFAFLSIVIHYICLQLYAASKSRAQGIPETCCLDKLASERGTAFAVSKSLIAVLSLALAQQCSLLTRSEILLPGIGPPHAPSRPPCPLDFDFDVDADTDADA